MLTFFLKYVIIQLMIKAHNYLNISRLFLFFCCIILINCSILNDSALQNTNSEDGPTLSIISDLNNLTIEAVPENADIYVNNRYEGVSPVLLEDMLPGVYKIEIEEDGYKKINTWITYNGAEETFFFELEPIIGRISIFTEPAESEIILGGREIEQGITIVPVGTYLLNINYFGYEKTEYQITINEDETTQIEENLIKSSFRIEDFNLSKSVLNPDNPGLLGQIDISFRVFSFGTGRISITDNSGIEVFSKEFDRFTTWEQLIEWSGESDSGSKVPDGEYSVNMHLIDEETSQLQNFSEPVQIDRDLKVNFRTGWSGNSGLIFTAVPRVLPKNNMQLSTYFMGHFDRINNFLIYNAPMCLFFRYGFGKNFELNVNAGIILKDITEIPYLFSSSLRFHYLKLNNRISFNSAVTGKITFQNKTGEDIYTNFTGISIGNPLELKAGPVSIIINPEITFSMWDVTYDSSFNNDPGFYVWLYTRAGILVDFGFISTGLSFAARTKAISRDFGFSLPLHTAFELNYMIPGTKLYLSISAIAEIGGANNFYIFGGGGLGYIN